MFVSYCLILKYLALLHHVAIVVKATTVTELIGINTAAKSGDM